MSRWATPGTKGQIGDREDLANYVSMITRDETPFMSSIGKTKATAILHEWQTDELNTPGHNPVTEGLDFSNSSTGGSPERARLNNYTQINSKELKVTGTRRAIDIAGVADEYAYQLEKRGTEMRRDIEFSMIHSLVGSSGTGARTFGSYFTYVANIVNGAGGGGAGSIVDNNTIFDQTLDTSPVYGSLPVGIDATTPVDIELNHVDILMQKIYEEGGSASKLMLSPQLRRNFSTKAQLGSSNVRRNIDDEGKLRQSVDVYMSDFGDLMVEPNYVMGLTNTYTNSASAALFAGATDENIANYFALVYDPMWFNVATLRPMQEVDVGQRGDSTVGMIIEECSLEVKNPRGSGFIYGLGATPA